MKRLATAVLAALTFAAPLAIAPPALADPPGYHHNDRNQRGGWDNHRGHRGERHHRGWDRQRHNGYTHNGRWYYGPPPAHVRGAQYGYHSWRRGDRLPGYYRDNYIVVRDYHRARLRPPPRGYHYIQDDRGDYLLVGVATGIILGVIASQ